MRGTPHTAGRRGKHHALALIATLALLPVLASAPVRAQGDPALEGSPTPAAPAPVSYTQRGVPAEASAENGVVARDRALANGRRAAWGRIASSLGITRSPSDAQIESMVTSMVIEEERIAPTRYTGRITVNFNPGRVRAFGGGSEVGGIASPESRGGGDPQAGDPGRAPPPVPASSSIEAVARYNNFREWAELRRRLGAAGPVARIEIIGIATDRARLRIGLRNAANVAAADLARIGVTLAPPVDGPGTAWRLGLAGGL